MRGPDLVNRNFRADRPDALWVTDLTYVPTRTGMAYVCFIVDAFSRRIVGWRVASNMRTDMVLDALEMARLAHAVTVASSASWHIRTPGRNLRPCGSLNGSTRSERDLRSARSPTRSTMRWRKRRTASTRLSASSDRMLRDRGRRRRTRIADVVVGSLVQRGSPPRSLRRHPTRRIRSSVLCCPTDRPDRGWKPINRVSIRARAVRNSCRGDRVSE